MYSAGVWALLYLVFLHNQKLGNIKAIGAWNNAFNHSTLSLYMLNLVISQIASAHSEEFCLYRIQAPPPPPRYNAQPH